MTLFVMSETIDDSYDPVLEQAASILGVQFMANRVRSGNESTVYELAGDDGRWFLKQDRRGLRAEAERLSWLQNRLPVPTVVAHVADADSELLLVTALEGKDLALLSQAWNPQAVVERLSFALKMLHGIDTDEWSLGDCKNGTSIVHGDACLPNFIFCEDGTFNGFIDVGGMRVDDVEVDLAAAVWSLDFNLGKGYGVSFLREYGIVDADDVMAERLHTQYAQDVLGGELPRWK